MAIAPVSAPVPAKKEMKLPDVGSFEAVVVPKQSGDVPGTVLGLDYDKWAAAYLDLSEREDRITAARNRLLARGYQLAEGAEVAGFYNAEVYVLPRSIYLQQVAAQRDELKAAVWADTLPASATYHPHCEYRHKKKA